MISVSTAVPINPPGEDVVLTRDDVWRGLVLKAENALPFVPAMTRCDVKSRTDSVIEREIEFRGERFGERITFDPKKQVTFVRTSGSVLGTIRNDIEEEDGDLRLRFSFDLELQGVEAGSDAEKDYEETMRDDYLKAAGATLAAIRRWVGEEAHVPDWVRDYYDNVDSMRLDDFVDSHTDDVVVQFADNPPAHGKEQVREAIGQFWALIDGLEHHFRRVHESGATTVLEGDIDYTRKDGQVVTVSCASILDRTPDGKVSRLRVYIDLAPVFA